MSKRTRRASEPVNNNSAGAEDVPLGSPKATGDPQPTQRISPVLLFAAIVTACLVLAVGYVAFAAQRGSDTQPSPTPTTVAASPAPTDPNSSPVPTGSGSLFASRLIFQNVDRSSGYAHVAVLPATDAGAQRSITELVCERVHYAGERGICLVPVHGLVTTYRAVTFDSNFQTVHQVDLAGAPTRARVSPDGRYGVATVFVFGHSYADANFSTQTILIDMESGESLGDLESFTTARDGAVWQSEDFNFWGVTFSPSDSNTYYATLRTAGRTYLVRGDVESRTMEVLRENVECPSLSPDGTRVAFKKLTEGLIGQWRLHVLDLETMTETALAETRNIDDQVEWLDNETVLYGDGQHIWSVPSDGSGSPMIFIADGLSPAAVR